MLYPTLNLRRTSHVVWAIVSRFALVSHKFRATFGASGYEFYRVAFGFSSGFINANDLRNNLTALLDIDIVVLVQSEFCYDVGVVERCPLNGRSCKLNRLHHGNRSYRACASHLIDDIFKQSTFAFGLEFVCDCPSWRLCSHAQMTLLSC